MQHIRNIFAFFKSIKRERFLRVSNRFLTIIGGVFVFAYLPAQAPLYAVTMLVGLVFVFTILYTLDGGKNVSTVTDSRNASDTPNVNS